MPSSSQPFSDGETPAASAAALKEVLRSYSSHPMFPDGEHLTMHSRTFDGDPVLHLAAHRGDLKAVEVLLAHGADPNVVGDMANTALHYAAMGGHAELVLLLLRQGAAPSASARNEFGKTPQEWAEAHGHTDAAGAIAARSRPIV